MFALFHVPAKYAKEDLAVFMIIQGDTRCTKERSRFLRSLVSLVIRHFLFAKIINLFYTYLSRELTFPYISAR